MPVAVFRRCVMSVGGMSGAPMGLAAIEIRAALELLDVPREDWPQVSADVSVLGQIAAHGRNLRAQAK